MKGEYRGYVTYASLLESSDISGAVIKEKLFLKDNLWDNAHTILQRRNIIPVFNFNMEMLYLAKYEHNLYKPWKQLEELRRHVNAELWKSFRNNGRHFHLIGINDVLFGLRKWLCSLGAEVSVEGEQWQFFGIQEESCKDKDAIIIEEDCLQLELLHKEYRSWMKNDILELEQLVFKPYIENDAEEGKILFYMPAFAYFMDSISPLIYKYLQSGKICIVTFPYVDHIISIGRENIRKVIAIIRDILFKGGRVCRIQDSMQEDSNKFSICYLCSEYSGILPIALRKISSYVVQLQTTAIYTHMYWYEDRFEKVFSDKERDNIDFLIASDYMADWICKQDKQWDEKILRFGYPKLDMLYNSLLDESNVPIEWKEKVNRRKVFLFTVMEEVWMDILLENGWVAIWRPHPLALEINADRIKKICEKYKNNIIIDDMLSYYASFEMADAMIAGTVISSIMVNYIFTGNPICFYESSSHKTVMDYAEEPWYKSAYVALEVNEVSEFIKMIGSNNDRAKPCSDEYRKFMMKEFDGKVCDRIYDYFDNLILD